MVIMLKTASRFTVPSVPNLGTYCMPMAAVYKITSASKTVISTDFIYCFLPKYPAPIHKSDSFTKKSPCWTARLKSPKNCPAPRTHAAAFFWTFSILLSFLLTSPKGCPPPGY